MATLANRVWTAFSPPIDEKKSGTIRFGILGTGKIVSLVLLIPAKSHPEVIVQAIAARNRTRAEEFAKKHGIPMLRIHIRILDDPKIDAICIPLPNSLHFEWSVRAIRAGKHILLEKPSVSNAIEANILFNMPELSQRNDPVLLEAFHKRFHHSMVPWLMTTKANIGFNYNLSRSSIMHMGTYNFAMLRMIFNAEPEECLTCDTNIFGDGIHDKCNYDFQAKFRFPNGGIGEATSSLRGPLLWKLSKARVTTREVVVPDKNLPATQEKALMRQVTLHGFMNAFI